MSAADLQMPRQFTFDEMYSMLREFVNNPEARQALSTYDAEFVAGRGNLYEGSCSGLAADSFGKFEYLGWSILVRNGWPDYGQIVTATQSDPDLRIKLIWTGTSFVDLGRLLIRKEPNPSGWSFQDEEFNIEERSSIYNLLKMWNERYQNQLLYTLER